ncbi:hypothetical protein JCM6882_006124 [Rhodosporidiobolus microsporus]
MGKKAASKGKAPASTSKPAPAAAAARAGKKGAAASKAAAPAASPATKLAKAKAVPLPRESSPDVEDRAASASEEEDDDEEEAGSEGEFDEAAFMKMVDRIEGVSDDEDAEMLDDEEDSDEDGDESEDVSPEALERMMKLLGEDVSESDIALLKAMKGEEFEDGDEEEDSEDDEEDEDVDEEALEAALKELEEASDVDADKEDITPVEKTTTNDKVALERVLASIALPASTSFFDTLTLVNPNPLNIVDPNNDLERELEFYKQSLWAAMHAESLHNAASLPFHRPSDYFAEMVKTDAHMAKLRQGLLDEQAGMKASEDARKLRDAKKFGKKVQQERLREREIEKKRMKEGVEGLKKKRKNGDAFSTGEDFDVALEDALASVPSSKKRKPNESERPGRGRKGISRNARDKKYGFGGGENGGRRGKQNNEKEDEKRGRGAFASRGGGRGGRGGGRGGRGGAKQRPGKSRRAQFETEMKVPPLKYCLYPSRESSREHHGLRAFIAVDGEPLPVYEMEEWGRTVMGSVQGEVGQQFEVVLYDGRKKVNRGYKLNVLFGKQTDSVAGLYIKPDYVKDMADDPKDDESRFTRFGSVRVDNHHIRPFRFSKVATTDKEGEAAEDINLNMLSTVKITYGRIKQAPKRKKTAKEKEAAKEQRKKQAEEKKSGAHYAKRLPSEPAAGSSDLLFEGKDKAMFAMSASLGDVITSEVPKKRKASTVTADNGGEPAASASKAASTMSYEDQYITSGSSWEYVYIDPQRVEVTFEFRIRSSIYIDKLAENNFPKPERAPDTKVLEENGELTILDSDDSEDEADIAKMEKKRLDKELEEEYGDDFLSDEEADEDEDDEDDPEEDDWWAPSASKRARLTSSNANQDAVPARTTRARGAAAAAAAGNAPKGKESASLAATKAASPTSTRSSQPTSGSVSGSTLPFAISAAAPFAASSASPAGAHSSAAPSKSPLQAPSSSPLRGATSSTSDSLPTSPRQSTSVDVDPAASASSPASDPSSPAKDLPLPSERELPDRVAERKRREAEHAADEEAKPHAASVKREEAEEKKVNLQRLKREEEEKRKKAEQERAQAMAWDWSQGI